MKRLIPALPLLTATTAHAAITPIILDEEGKPLAGVRVRAFSRGDNGPLRKRLLSQQPETPPILPATTGADGRGALALEAEPAARLVADPPRRAARPVHAV